MRTKTSGHLADGHRRHWRINSSHYHCLDSIPISTPVTACPVDLRPHESHSLPYFVLAHVCNVNESTNRERCDSRQFGVRNIQKVDMIHNYVAVTVSLAMTNVCQPITLRELSLRSVPSWLIISIAWRVISRDLQDNLQGCGWISFFTLFCAGSCLQL